MSPGFFLRGLARFLRRFFRCGGAGLGGSGSARTGGGWGASAGAGETGAVSYTHLTLPTKLE
ncbi:MAG: hypothetical protein KUG77_29505, partial [Nannocystaceae bacterium]|nr:hypothetical protein [Nannocystaceae bacterium]